MPAADGRDPGSRNAPSLQVSVVVPCHAAAHLVSGLLAALAAQTLRHDLFEVVLADPGHDGTARVVERWLNEHGEGLRVKLVATTGDGGPAVKRNVGARHAEGALLAFTDADCLPEPGWLEAGLAAFEDGARMIQGVTLPPPGQTASFLDHSIHVLEDHGLHETCNMFFERRLFESLRGFPAAYFHRYGVPFGEDAHLGWQARRAGAAYVFEPSAVVRHPVQSRGLGAHLRERWLGRGFPVLVRELPELRQALLYRRVFLSRRSAAFTGALAGALVCRRSPAGAILALPYAVALSRERRPATRVLSDAVTFVGLVAGSVRARRVVL